MIQNLKGQEHSEKNPSTFCYQSNKFSFMEAANLVSFLYMLPGIFNVLINKYICKNKDSWAEVSDFVLHLAV